MIFSAGLLAFPVIAQTEGTSAEETGAEQPATLDAPAATIGCQGEAFAAAADAGEDMSAVNRGSQEELRSALAQAGFEDVQVLSTGYVMEATAPNNECLLIIVDTGSQVTGLAGVSGAATAIAESAEISSTGTAGEQTEPGGSAEDAAQASMGTEDAASAFGDSSLQITGDLIDSGYTGVTVLQSTFVVVARAPGGHLVAMTVRKDEPAE